ncbi:MAG: hypothetical protein WC610_00905 [Patescibacteria group bacterium]
MDKIYFLGETEEPKKTWMEERLEREEARKRLMPSNADSYGWKHKSTGSMGLLIDADSDDGAHFSFNSKSSKLHATTDRGRTHTTLSTGLEATTQWSVLNDLCGGLERSTILRHQQTHSVSRGVPDEPESSIAWAERYLEGRRREKEERERSMQGLFERSMKSLFGEKEEPTLIFPRPAPTLELTGLRPEMFRPKSSSHRTTSPKPWEEIESQWPKRTASPVLPPVERSYEDYMAPVRWGETVLDQIMKRQAREIEERDMTMGRIGDFENRFTVGHMIRREDAPRIDCMSPISSMFSRPVSFGSIMRDQLFDERRNWGF